MMRTTLALAVLLILTCTSRSETPLTKVPFGKSPTMDGTLAAEEWKDALPVELDPEGEALLLQDEKALYVGLRVGRNCIPSLAVHQEDKILVLHASASLGTAAYARSGEAWRANRKFTWRCRDGQTSDEERASFTADEGWFATTNGVGRPGEAEYTIDRRLLKGAFPRLAIVACRLQPMPPTACAWPKTVRDGTRNQDLLFGKTPDLDFDPESWAQLDLGRAPTSAERFEAGLDDVEAEQDPVDAYRALLDLLAEHREQGTSSERARRLRQRLE